MPRKYTLTGLTPLAPNSAAKIPETILRERALYAAKMAMQQVSPTPNTPISYPLSKQDGLVSLVNTPDAVDASEMEASYMISYIYLKLTYISVGFLQVHLMYPYKKQINKMYYHLSKKNKNLWQV
jgi:hypothetical protein